MAPPKKINDIYNQKKKLAVARKPAAPNKPESKKKKQTKGDVEEVEDDDIVNATEKTLREFDMNMKYGPCIGMTRLERWERANKFGLNPPKDVEILLKSGLVDTQCCWNPKL